MNREEIRNRILYLLNDDITSPVFFTLAKVNTVIQEAMEIITEEVSDLRREAFITIEPGRYLYTTAELSPTAMTPMRVWSDLEGERLDVITMRQLDEHEEQWMLTTENKPTWWYPVSHDCFGIWPAPTTGGGILRVEYLAWPEEITDDGNIPKLRDTEQDLIVLYGQYDGMVRQWEVDRGMEFFRLFAQAFRDQSFKNKTRRTDEFQFNRGGSETHRSEP